MQFLQNIISELLENHQDLSALDIVLPGKRPMVFIKRILQEKQYQGLLPNFVTIDELIAELSENVEIKGIALWLFSFRIYTSLHLISAICSFDNNNISLFSLARP